MYQSTALRFAHSIPVAGHGGMLVTSKRLESIAFIPNMKKVSKGELLVSRHMLAL